MGKIFFDVGLSLDGFIAGENRGPQNPLGDQGTNIHHWMYRQNAFWRSLGMEGGEEEGIEGTLIENVFARTGSYIMGKRMFEEGEANWPEDLFKADVFVLTHEQREPWVQKGTTTFYFINDGIESVLTKAKASAKGKDIRIQGGAETIQQFLNAGRIDEFTIHTANCILGNGIRLFDQLKKGNHLIELLDVVHTPHAIHSTYQLNKQN